MPIWSGQGPRRRAIRKMGRPITVINYSDNGNRDKYGDPTGFTEDKVDTKATMEMPDNPNPLTMPSGEERRPEVRFYVPDNIEIHEAGDDSHVKPSHIRDKNTGMVYEVIHVWRHLNGVNRVFCTDS